MTQSTGLVLAALMFALDFSAGTLANQSLAGSWQHEGKPVVVEMKV